jgi:hypothetical protein
MLRILSIDIHIKSAFLGENLGWNESANSLILQFNLAVAAKFDILFILKPSVTNVILAYYDVYVYDGLVNGAVFRVY